MSQTRARAALLVRMCLQHYLDEMHKKAAREGPGATKTISEETMVMCGFRAANTRPMGFMHDARTFARRGLHVFEQSPTWTKAHHNRANELLEQLEPELRKMKTCTLSECEALDEEDEEQEEDEEKDEEEKDEEKDEERAEKAEKAEKADEAE